MCYILTTVGPATTTTSNIWPGETQGGGYTSVQLTIRGSEEKTVSDCMTL